MNPKELTIDELYALSLDKLYEMARAVGVRFSEDYRGPYKISPMIVHEGDQYNYSLEDRDDYYKAFLSAKQITIYNVGVNGSPFRRWYDKDKAAAGCEQLNKRHAVCAMLSSDPKFPVLI